MRRVQTLCVALCIARNSPIHINAGINYAFGIRLFWTVLHLKILPSNNKYVWCRSIGTLIMSYYTIFFLLKYLWCSMHFSWTGLWDLPIPTLTRENMSTHKGLLQIVLLSTEDSSNTDLSTPLLRYLRLLRHKKCGVSSSGTDSIHRVDIRQVTKTKCIYVYFLKKCLHYLREN